MRVLEKALYSAIAAAFVDTGCNADFARFVVEYGLTRSRVVCKRALSLI